MKDFYIASAADQENKVIISSFVVASKQVKAKKTGEPYLALTLSNRTGQLEAKMWDNVAGVMETFEQDDFIKVKGLLNKYNGRYQITIHKLRRLEEQEVDPADYLPKCPRDIEELWRDLGAFVATLENPHLKALIEAFMADPEIAPAYKTAPAAKTLHHAYVGGLLDHVVSLFRLCDLAARNYPRSTATCCSPAPSCTISARSMSSPTGARSPTPAAGSCWDTWSSSWRCCTPRSPKSRASLTG